MTLNASIIHQGYSFDETVTAHKLSNNTKSVTETDCGNKFVVVSFKVISKL